MVAPGPHRGPFRGPQNRARPIGISPARVSDISAFDISWFRPLSEPSAFQVEPGLSAAWTQYTAGASLPLIFPDRWHQSLAEPQRRRDMPVAGQPWAFTIDTRTPENPATTFWFSWLSEPQRRRDLPAAEHPFFAIDAQWSAPAPTGVPAFFYNWLSEPVQLEPGLGGAWSQYTTGFAAFAPASVVPPFFYNWLSEPVRRKPELPPALQQFYTTDWKWSATIVGVFTYTFVLSESGDTG
jgi:hypothetical protein